MILTASPAVAGLYGLEPSPFAESPGARVEPLSFQSDNTGRFPLEFARAGNLGDSEKNRLERRKRVEELVILQSQKIERSPDGWALLAGEWIRCRDYGHLQEIQRLARDRNPNYYALMNLAHSYAMQGQWDEAVARHQSAMTDAEFPDMPNKAWFQRLEKDYYRRWLQLRQQAAKKPVPPAVEQPPDLFQGPPPADAIAIVQQLLLWYPSDNGLFWLLADLYAKAGQPRVALHICNSLASNDRLHSNRTVMMRERTRLAALVAALPPEAEPVIPLDPPDTRPAWERLGVSTPQLILAGGAFVLVAGVLFYFQFRKLLRRRR